MLGLQPSGGVLEDGEGGGAGMEEVARLRSLVSEHVAFRSV